MNKYKIRTIICASCGKSVTKRMRPTQKYCSLECYRNGPRPSRKNGKDKTCEWCKKEYYVPKCRVESSRFCSKECSDQWQARNKIEYTCKICKKNFYWSPSRDDNHNVTYCSLECRDNDPERREMLIEMNVAQQKLSPNKLEKAGYAILDSLNIEYKQQHTIAGKFCVDAFIPLHDIVVQFDGEYWHGYPDKYPDPDKRQAKRMQLDRSQDAYMKECGYQILRFWESEIYNYPNKVKQVLISAIQT